MAKLKFVKRIQFTPAINIICVMQGDIYSDGKKLYAFVTLNNPESRWHENALAKITPIDGEDTKLQPFGIRMDLSMVPPGGFFAYPDQIVLPPNAESFAFEFVRIDGKPAPKYEAPSAVVAENKATKRPEVKKPAPAPAAPVAPPAVASVVAPVVPPVAPAAPAVSETPAPSPAPSGDGNPIVYDPTQKPEQLIENPQGEPVQTETDVAASETPSPETRTPAEGYRIISGKVVSKFKGFVLLFYGTGKIYVHGADADIDALETGTCYSVTGKTAYENGVEKIVDASFAPTDERFDEAENAPFELDRGLPTAKERKEANNIEVVTFTRKKIRKAPFGFMTFAGIAFGLIGFAFAYMPAMFNVVTPTQTQVVGGVTYATVGNELSVSNVDSSVTSLNIPRSLNGKRVTKLASGAINQYSNVQSINAPYLTSVEDGAVSSYGLKSIEVGTSLTSGESLTIAKKAFYSPNLTSVRLGGRYSIDQDAFSSLGTTTFSESGNAICDDVVLPNSGTINFSTLTIDSTSSIGFYGSGGNLNIDELIVSSGRLSSANFSRFQGYMGSLAISKVTTTSNYYTIADRAFYNVNLKSYDFNSSIRTIGNYAFTGTTFNSLGSSLEISTNSLTSIGSYAFQNVTKFSQYYLNCPNLNSANIGNDAFPETATVYLNGVAYTGNKPVQEFRFITSGNTITGCENPSLCDSSVTIPSYIDRIESGALNYLAAETVHLNMVSYVGSNAFAYSNVQRLLSANSGSISFESSALRNMSYLSTIDLDLATVEFLGSFNLTRKVTISCARFYDTVSSFNDRSYNVGLSIANIDDGDLSMLSQDGIVNISIGKLEMTSVGKIPNRTFYGRSRLNSFFVSDTNGSFIVGECAFQYCSSLSGFHFDLLKEAQDYAFNGTDFVSVNLPNCTFLGTQAFFACSRLTSANVKSAYYDSLKTAFDQKTTTVKAFY